MKIDRLLGILTALLHYEKATMPFLAEKFEVSKRTIQRDVDTLSRAGIPILVVSGSGGGVSIMNGFTIDKSLLKADELSAILIGIKGLDSVSTHKRYKGMVEKLGRSTAHILELDKSITINLASYYKDSLSPKIEMLRVAIGGRQWVDFDYYSLRGESHKKVKPFHLTFQWDSWYVWGEEKGVGEARLYKLNRLWNLTPLEEIFSEEEVAPFHFSIENTYLNGVPIKVRFQLSAKWRLIEEYGPTCFTEEGETLLFKGDFENTDYFLQWILSFGEEAELLEPEDLRRRLKERLTKALKRYETN